MASSYEPAWRDQAIRAIGTGCSSRHGQGAERRPRRLARGLGAVPRRCRLCLARRAACRARSPRASRRRASPIRAQIIWDKTRLVIGRGDYHWQHEPAWYAVRQGQDRALVRRPQADHGVGDPAPRSRETGHGTQKPVACMQRPIENNSSPGQAVYEPFCGSGTTIIAAEMTGRSATPSSSTRPTSMWPCSAGRTSPARPAMLRGKRHELRRGRRRARCRDACVGSGEAAGMTAGRAEAIAAGSARCWRPHQRRARLRAGAGDRRRSSIRCSVSAPRWRPTAPSRSIFTAVSLVRSYLVRRAVRDVRMRSRECDPCADVSPSRRTSRCWTAIPGRRPLNPGEPRPELRVPDLPAASVPERQGGMEAPCAATVHARHPDRARSRDARRLLPVVWPLGRGRAEAQGDAGAAEDAVRLRAAESLADHRQQAARTDAQLHERTRALAGLAQPRQRQYRKQAQALGVRPQQALRPARAAESADPGG